MTNCASNMDQFSISVVSGRRFFIVDEGMMSEIFSVIYYPDPNPVPNWDPYMGNFLLPARFGEAK